ncbi:MAG: hypothetical protein AMJ92_12635 [candidate division Zixibacteria bacterium SM23_81]|nr:MAG: hypothetical protein AMJ92_12635 [candidate division Zixibacteria bacterium SM23_81]
MKMRRGHFQNLFNQSIVYGLGRLVGQAVGFFLIPIYTRSLSTENYGVFALLTMAVSVLSIVLGMGVGSAFFKYYFSSPDEGTKDSVTDSAFFLLVVVSLAAVLVLLPLSSQLSQLLFGSTNFAQHLKYLAWTALLNTLSIIPLSLLRAKEQSLRYSAITLTKFIFMLGLNIFFVVVLRKGVIGILQANLLSAAAMFLILVVPLCRSWRARLSWVHIKALLAFGAPLMPTQIASWVLTLSDRYLLKYLTNLEEVGVYTLGYNLGFAVNLLIIWPFSVAWGPFMYKVAGEQNASQVYARTLTYIGLASGSISLILSLFAPVLVSLVSPSAYFNAHKIIPLVAFSYAFYGMYFVFTAGLNITKRTYYFPFIVGFSAAMNIILNLIFIPYYGMMAAAWSTFVSYLVLAFLTYACSQKFFRVPYEYTRLAKLVMALLLVLVIGQVTKNSAGFLGFLLRTILFLMFPILLYILRFFRQEEIAKISTLLGLRSATQDMVG